MRIGKMISFKRCGAMIVGISIFGCASQPISNQQARPVPLERILDSTFLKPAPNSGEIVVKRDSGLIGSACSTRIFLNGKPVADIRPSEKIVMYLPEGEHIVSANPNGICGGGMTEVKAVVKAGTQSSFRFGTSGNGSPSIYPTAF
jgi:hypothetical protein